MTTKEMLEQEIKLSTKYTKENFGQQVGDGYPEMVREVAQSQEAVMQLILSLTLGMLSGKEISKSMGEHAKKDEMHKIVLENSVCFQGQLSMLYWGINIGRKLQQEEDRMIKNLEGDAHGAN
jgi:hypothetical protein